MNYVLSWCKKRNGMQYNGRLLFELLMLVIYRGSFLMCKKYKLKILNYNYIIII